MRGEEDVTEEELLHFTELPPHARRRARPARCGRLDGGITSACAEKSRATDAIDKCEGNYLRMRGEETRATT